MTYEEMLAESERKYELERAWPEIWKEDYKGDQPIELTNGELLIKRYGKYTPNLTFILNEDGKHIVWSKNIPDLNINFDGEAKFIPGEFWVSKKGTKCFRPKVNGPHVLIRINWGGCFERSRGYEFEQVSPLAIYSRRASSNGGGSGFNFYVFQKDFRHEVSIDEI